MRFQVLNDKGVAVMGTSYLSCIPDRTQIESMAKAGYRFKLDGKIISRKKLEAYIDAENKKEAIYDKI